MEAKEKSLPVVGIRKSRYTFTGSSVEGISSEARLGCAESLRTSGSYRVGVGYRANSTNSTAIGSENALVRENWRSIWRRTAYQF